jgi:hypothetical protein
MQGNLVLSFNRIWYGSKSKILYYNVKYLLLLKPEMWLNSLLIKGQNQKTKEFGQIPFTDHRNLGK